MSGTMVRQDGNSPFDAIRQVRDDGSEFWSARALSKLVKYETWRNFAATIDRAKVACENSETPAQRHFVGASKVYEMPNGGTNSIDDVELSRFAAYLVVMNGDPRKPAIAQAQQYFAVRTRQAETAAAPALTREDRLAIGMQALQEVVAEQTAQISVLEPKARKFDNFLGADGDNSVSEAAGILQRAGIDTGEIRLFEALRMMRWTYKDHKGRPRAYQSAKTAGLLAEKPAGEWVDDDGGVHIRCPQVRVTPKGMARLLDELRVAS